MASTLSSTSTLAQIRAAYADNASYEEDASRSKALAFITACRMLLDKVPLISSKSAESVQLQAKYDAEITSARAWLSANPDTSTGGGVTRAEFANFRS